MPLLPIKQIDGLETVLSNAIPYTGSTFTGTGDRFLVADANGDITASDNSVLEAYLTIGTNTALLDDIANWDITGVYIGTALTGTFKGQKHYNSNYFFEAVDDNIFIRLIRG